MNTVVLIGLSSDEHQVGELVGPEETNDFCNVSTLEGIVNFSEIDISDLGSSLDVNAVNVDGSGCFLDTFLLLDVGFVFKNVEGNILTTVSLELFNFEDLVNQLLSLNSLWVIFLENVDLPHEVHKSLLVG